MEALVERVRVDPGLYPEVQRDLGKVAPEGRATFHELRADPRVVFRDITPALVVLGAAAKDPGEPAPQSANRAFLRGRRWGKSVLLDAWLEFLRGNRDLFAGTWVEHHARPGPLVGVKLDLSRCSSYGAFVQHVAEQINEGLALAGLEERLLLRRNSVRYFL